MANWGEHLINFLLDLSAALVAAWLIWKYSSKLSDYWAQRSTGFSAKKGGTVREIACKIRV